jgi:hypothetical protein
LKKYQRLTCTKCNRDIDKLVNITHYSPDRCTITQGCEGRLYPVEYKSSAGIATSPEVGITDWQFVPRIPGHSAPNKVVNPSLATQRLINLATGSLNQIVVASTINKPTLTVQFEGKADTPKAYRAYVFRREGVFTAIAGVESGLEKKALRFSTDDMVEVFLNGVKQEPGKHYSIADGSNTSVAPPNTIVFTQAVDQSGIAQVDVIVSKEEAAASYSLVFKRNISDESRRNSGAYENISSVSGMIDSTSWKAYYLYTLDLGDIDIPLNTILVPKDTDAVLLLARKPYTQLDRYTSIVIPLREMNTTRLTVWQQCMPPKNPYYRFFRHCVSTSLLWNGRSRFTLQGMKNNLSLTER